jgi:hypothetical protein
MWPPTSGGHRGVVTTSPLTERKTEMAQHTLRRGASALGVAGLLALALAAPASARQDKGNGSLHDDITTGPPSSVPTKIVFKDDGALEYLQVGAGALAGMTLAGGAAVAVGRRHRTHPTPA